MAGTFSELVRSRIIQICGRRSTIARSEAMEGLIAHLFGPPLCIAAVLPPKKCEKNGSEHDQWKNNLGKIDAAHISAPRGHD
jgi:hypothetical protein